MATTPLTLRLNRELLQRLEEQSSRAGQPRAELARTLLDEGLRMETHPGIVFRSGPAGRRPGLANGPDVWEVIRVLKGIDASGEDRLQRVAKSADLSPDQVRTAIQYYIDFSGEIDAWIRQADHIADEAEADWRQQRNQLSG